MGLIQSPEHEFPVNTPIPVEQHEVDRATILPRGIECVVICPVDRDGYHPVEYRDGMNGVVHEGSRPPERLQDAYDAEQGVFHVDVPAE